MDLKKKGVFKTHLTLMKVRKVLNKTNQCLRRSQRHSKRMLFLRIISQISHQSIIKIRQNTKNSNKILQAL